jgi:hypothetical protein
MGVIFDDLNFGISEERFSFEMPITLTTRAVMHVTLKRAAEGQANNAIQREIKDFLPLIR